MIIMRRSDIHAIYNSTIISKIFEISKYKYHHSSLSGKPHRRLRPTNLALALENIEKFVFENVGDRNPHLRVSLQQSSGKISGDEAHRRRIVYLRLSLR